MFGKCALRLCQCIHRARQRGVLSRRIAVGSGPLVARRRQVHAPCETETGNRRGRRSSTQAHRYGVLGYKGARRKRLAQRDALRGRRGYEPPLVTICRAAFTDVRRRVDFRRWPKTAFASAQRQTHPAIRNTRLRSPPMGRVGRRQRNGQTRKGCFGSPTWNSRKTRPVPLARGV